MGYRIAAMLAVLVLLVMLGAYSLSQLQSHALDPWEQHDLLEASDDPGLERVVASLERLRDALVGTHPASASP